MTRKKKKKSFLRKLIGLIMELLVLVILVGVIYIYKETYGKVDYQGELTQSEAGINEEITAETVEILEGYTNIALFGLDNRSSGEFSYGNSDTIMIASIDNATGDVRLVSVYRDTYLNIASSSEDKYRKANAAYAYGGATQAVSMLNMNLDLDITEYVCVDWLAVVEAIDALGGIDLELTSQEVSQINKYKPDVVKMTGISSPDVSLSDGNDGVYHLDGVQGTTYARIRKTSGDDYLRSSRQRIVLEKMLEKAKAADPVTLAKVASAIFDDISTSLTLNEILSLVKNVSRYNIASTTGFPFELTTKYLKTTNDTVVPINLAANVAELHEYLFSEEDYQVTDKVQRISDDIAYLSGVYDGAAAVDTSLYNETVGASGTEDAKSQNAASEEEE